MRRNETPSHEVTLGGRQSTGMVGIAVGTIAVPDSPRLIRSVFEQSKHGWVEIAGAEHFQQGSTRKR